MDVYVVFLDMDEDSFPQLIGIYNTKWAAKASYQDHEDKQWMYVQKWEVEGNWSGE